ncbi:hypothetical protein BGZ65_007435 [Modicella reniformis]|uniref:Uncharacterized protein n=1 Tax=Modicella reniformis TaxID=1440133 RepID=A0A9P6MBT5_9FUNG|nr:hypothetical protein BGZ65_007435 [Modicella reniformis]
MTDHRKTPPEIHLAKHEGYDLEIPTEFFEIYGAYILALMYMVKFGITVAGLVVPPLACLKILEVLYTTQGHVQYLKRNIDALIGETVEVLQDFTNTDLSQLESYLKVKDQKRVLGNLHRIITSEGNIKWVCLDHYRINYQEPVIRQLQEVVKGNEGTFIEETSRIEIKIESNIIAKQFYDAMVQGRDHTEHQSHSAAISKASSVLGAIKSPPQRRSQVLRQPFGAILCIDSTDLELRNQYSIVKAVFGILSKPSKLVSLKHRCRKLTITAGVSKGKVEEMGLTTERRLSLFMNYSHGNMNMTIKRLSDLTPDDFKFIQRSQFRRLTIGSIPHEGDEDRLGDVFRHSPTLSRFQIQCTADTFGLRLQVVSRMASMNNYYEPDVSLDATHEGFNINVRISNGKIQNLKATLDRLSGLNPDVLSLIQGDHLSNMMIMNSIEEEDEGRLPDVLHHSPNLEHLRIECKTECFLAIPNLVISIRTSIMQKSVSCYPQTIELMKERLTPFGEFSSYRNYIQSVITFSEDLTSLSMRMCFTDKDQVNDFIRQYGWSIVFFQETSTENDRFTATVGRYTYRQRLSVRKPRIVAIVSAPPQVTTSFSPAQSFSRNIVDKSAQSESESKWSWTALRKVVLRNVKRQPKEWKTVTEAIDLSELLHLSLHMSNITHESFKLLIDRIPDNNTSKCPFKTLDIRHTNVVLSTRTLLEELWRKAPLVKIMNN